MAIATVNELPGCDAGIDFGGKRKQILALYLLSTLAGSKIYRVWNKRNLDEPALIWLGLGFCALLSLAAGDPEFRILPLLRPVLGIAPLSMVLGFLTPMLVDRWSQGDPDRAGTAYAANVAGCILGPLLSGFLLLPFISEHWVICIFAFPWVALGLSYQFLSNIPKTRQQSWVAYALVALALQFPCCLPRSSPSASSSTCWPTDSTSALAFFFY